MHLCFEVDDVHACANRLRAQGIDMLDGPNLVESGPLAGFNWIYFRAPWGLILEVASFAELGYERNSPHRLWRVERK
jgi:extradiol dioxygenase family protein